MSLSRAGGSQNSKSAGKEENEGKKKNDREGQSRGGGNKKRERERQASFRNRGRAKERTPGFETSPTAQCFYIFSFPQWRFLSCHFTDRQATTGSFPEVDRRNSSTAVSSLPSPVCRLVMDCFSLSFHPGETPQV